MASLRIFCPITNIIIIISIIETKQDRFKKVDPMLIFPLKAWLRGFLPGSKFTWEFTDEIDVEKEVKITVVYFNRCGRCSMTVQ